ncbi:hypothetical protein DWG18_03895 [Lysobacter sp. TY2-98]|uniref:DUF6491 family protein n=1 Tax=Lysobacter sp. TY2-98 TaxID=2290922 RepID=UPI000E20C738|nr:DUF6491 family protein [Lysobacter sp. TY2-98]AXK71518.1 hypothetical protein DWG18_03895 [Lysobacter sp. TY2-98]
MRRLALLALLAMSLSACATGRDDRTASKLALYREHAGAPVDSFPYLAPLKEWTPLGRDALAVWTSPSRAWLLEVSDCSELEWAQAISLSDSGSRVSARFDRVTPLSRNVAPMSCRIEVIRPLDVDAIRAAERAARGT